MTNKPSFHLPIILYPVFLCIFLGTFWYDVHSVPLVLSHIPFALSCVDALRFKQWSTSIVMAVNTGVSTWYHVDEYNLHTINHPSRRLSNPLSDVIICTPFDQKCIKRGYYARGTCNSTEYSPSNTFVECSKHWSYWENTTVYDAVKRNIDMAINKIDSVLDKAAFSELKNTVRTSTRLDFTTALFSLHYMAWQMAIPLDIAFALSLVGLVCHQISGGTAFTTIILVFAVILACGRKRSIHAVAAATTAGVALHFYTIGLTFRENDHTARWTHYIWHIMAGWAASHAIRARMGQWKIPTTIQPENRIHTYLQNINILKQNDI